MDLPEHDQGHRKMLALIERAIDLDRLLGGRHPFLGTSVREGATGDGKIGQQASLEAEVADTMRDIEPASANLHRFRRVDDRVEHAKVGVAATRHVEEAGGFGCRDTLLHLAYRLLVSPKPRQRNPLVLSTSAMARAASFPDCSSAFAGADRAKPSASSAHLAAAT